MLFNMLRDVGYYIETLGSPLTCFDARQYGTLLMVDLEEEYFPEEIEKLKDDVINGGLGLIVFSEWYHVGSMVKMRFFDDNTKSWWTPITGGANIPAINDLLAPFGIAFGGKILTSDFSVNGEQSHYASGTDIVKFPGGGYIHSFLFQDNSDNGVIQNILPTSGMNRVESPILGLVEVGGGRVAVYGDSNCLDSSHMVTNCYWLLQKILDFTSMNTRDPVLFSNSVKRDFPLYDDDTMLPSRRTDVNFSLYSAVSGKQLLCHCDFRFEVWGTPGAYLQLIKMNRKIPGYLNENAWPTNSNMTIEKPSPEWDQHREKYGNISRTIEGRKISNSVEFLIFLNCEELDLQVPLFIHWILPSFVVITCLMLLSFWGMKLKRKRRRRGSSTSSRMLNIV